MPYTFNEPNRPFSGLLYSQPLSFDEVETDTEMEPMTVVADASGNKVVPYDNISKTASGVVLYSTPDASGNAVVAIRRHAELDGAQLQWHEDANDAAKASALADLATQHIIVRS